MSRPVHSVHPFSVGAQGDPSLLIERRREREREPRRRIPLAELAFAGEWGRPAF